MQGTAREELERLYVSRMQSPIIKGAGEVFLDIFQTGFELPGGRLKRICHVFIEGALTARV